MDTMDAYVVHYPHLKVFKPTSEICCNILKKKCLFAAQVFDRQTGREYEFGKFCLSNPPRATELNLLSNEELVGLAGFGRQAEVAKFKNQVFTAKRIRNDCTLLISDSFQTKH